MYTLCGHQCLLALTLFCSADHFAVLHYRPPPDKTKDKEGVSLNRTPLNQRSRGQPPPPPPPAEDSEEEGEEEGEEVTAEEITIVHVHAAFDAACNTKLAASACPTP